MSDGFDITLQTANRDRKAELGVDGEVRVGELLDMAKSQWSLPGDYEYIIRCERLGRQLRSDETLGAAGVLSGDRLEIFPMADYGSQR